jgi:hypothetical protein
MFALSKTNGQSCKKMSTATNISIRTVYNFATFAVPRIFLKNRKIKIKKIQVCATRDELRDAEL